MRVLLCAALCSVLAAGCASAPANAPPGPPSYRVGYSHGCDSGLREAGNPYYSAKRDWSAYQADGIYRQGFDEGRAACFASYNRLR